MSNILQDKKVYMINHIDLDAVGALVLAEYYLKPIVESIDFLCTDYDSLELNIDLNLVEDSDYIIFTDISVTLEFYLDLKKLNPNIYIFDHHESAFDNLGEQENYIYDPTKSGTKIFFEWLTKDRRVKPIIQQFVDLVDTYDLFKKKSPLFKMAKSLNNILYASAAYFRSDFIEKHRSFMYTQIKKFDSFDEYNFLNSEIKKLKEEEKKEQEVYDTTRKKMKFRVDGEKNIYIYAEMRAKISVVASRILEDNPKAVYMVVYNVYKKSDKKISIRSLEYPVNIIAEKWGGGGHRCAAGAIINDDNDFRNFISGRAHLI